MLIPFKIIHLKIPRTNIRNSLGSQKERIEYTFNVKTHNKILVAKDCSCSSILSFIETLATAARVFSLLSHSLASVDDERKPLEVVRVNGCAD